ncbi:hypothetical protein ACIRVF_15765 [Kitasatospora sp. NPDC101157]|uniref:hypothetical protein n=1 Tax=Kitasatospora sp. NPDC101157 TaxID=3364098 RepID=UPI00381C1808
MNPRPPLAGAKTWQHVIDTAGARCQCTGTCGKNHAKTDGRCERVHGGYQHQHGGGQVRLIAAPADPANLLLPAHRITALPMQALAAWCPACHDATRTKARKAEQDSAPAAEPDALF